MRPALYHFKTRSAFDGNIITTKALYQTAKSNARKKARRTRPISQDSIPGNINSHPGRKMQQRPGKWPKTARPLFTGKEDRAELRTPGTVAKIGTFRVRTRRTFQDAQKPKANGAKVWYKYRKCDTGL